MYQGRWWARFWRVFVATAAYMAVAMFVIRLMGPAESPYRGSLAAHLEPALRHLGVFAALFLVFFVVDATVFCYQLVSELRKKLPAHDDSGPEVAPASAARRAGRSRRSRSTPPSSASTSATSTTGSRCTSSRAGPRRWRASSTTRSS